jgi:hypothetical protein
MRQHAPRQERTDAGVGTESARGNRIQTAKSFTLRVHFCGVDGPGCALPTQEDKVRSYLADCQITQLAQLFARYRRREKKTALVTKAERSQEMNL